MGCERHAQVDRFYGGGVGGKVRASHSEPGDRLLGIMRKEKIADLSIYMPGTPFDVRLSINVEHPGKA